MMIDTATHPALVIDTLAVRLGRADLFRITATVAPGSILTIMGPSGSGKSTLLAVLAGFQDRAFTVSGELRLGGQDLFALPAAVRRAGLLFQDPLLYPHLSVRGNVVFALPPGGTRQERRATADAALADMGLQGFGPRDPASLSGGQKARVALARLLVSAPRYLLLDEPFANLDRDLRQQIRSLIFERARARALPVVLATHDEEDAVAADGDVLRFGVNPEEQG